MTIHTKHSLNVFSSADELNKAAAELIITIAHESVAARGRFVIALSGGSTPEKLYSLLASPACAAQIDWEKTSVFWGDERCVPLKDPRNNAFHARSLLLDHVPLPPSSIFIIPVNLSPPAAAKKYEKELHAFFGKERIRFDLALLGLGENGHTASLFPGTPVIADEDEGVRDVFVAEENMHRITLTAPLINRSRNILFLVTGNKKAAILKKIFMAPFEPEKYPAQLIDPVDGDLFWYADSAAAALTSTL